MQVVAVRLTADELDALDALQPRSTTWGRSEAVRAALAQLLQPGRPGAKCCHTNAPTSS